MKKKIIIVIGVVLVIALGVLGYLYLNKEKNTNIDGKKFAEEYTSVTKDNVFVYRSAEEIINILEHGTGVVYLGFPECPWCTAYVPYLNEVAKANDVDKVYYYNILNDRKNNTDNYKKMVDIEKYGEDATKDKVYVPEIIVYKHKILLDCGCTADELIKEQPDKNLACLAVDAAGYFVTYYRPDIERKNFDNE